MSEYSSSSQIDEAEDAIRVLELDGNLLTLMATSGPLNNLAIPKRQHRAAMSASSSGRNSR
eukprot:6885836-Heterocapsa_arctica.AAC.1